MTALGRDPRYLVANDEAGRQQVITLSGDPRRGVGATGISESDVTPEIECYMAMPGQACAYKLGQLKILELREKARAALGPKFNLQDFHAVVLENGAVPLTLLEQLMDAWIARGGGPDSTG